jgi:exopolysaccharide biosynthesis protein
MFQTQTQSISSAPRYAEAADASPVESSPPGRRPRRWLRILLSTLGVVVVVLAAAAWWALDRYIIDHVEISDVAAYEAAVLAEGTSAASSTDDTATGEPVDEEAVVVDSESATSDEETAGEETVVTSTSYSDGETSIEISTVVVGSGRSTVTYYVADVVLSDATDLRAGFANNQFGTNIIADTSEIAEYYDAVFAVNGDYYGFRETGIVIRNGVVYRDDGARIGLAIYADGTMEVYDETTTTAEKLLAAGVYNTLSFGPALVDDGEIVDGIESVEVDTNFGNHSIQGNQPRTGIGIINDDLQGRSHFVFVVVDGRSPGYSTGVTMTEFAEIFLELGATEAYNLDGGGSATMYFNGELVNNPLGRGEERGTSDILYVAVGEGTA